MDWYQTFSTLLKPPLLKETVLLYTEHILIGNRDNYFVFLLILTYLSEM